jgi:hypothetical protein
MTRRDPDPALRRSRRKQDLLLASGLARGQAVGAFDEIADRADRFADRVLRVGTWLSSPTAAAAGAATASLLLAVVLRRVRIVRMLRWAWLARSLWRSAAPVLARFQATR